MEVVKHHFERIDSTNTWGKLNAGRLERDKITLVTADAQTQGRGRFKRRWESPPNHNIYASLCFFIDRQRRDVGNIPQVLALVIARVLESLSFAPNLKWPNDVLLGEKKVGGILAETSQQDDKLCVVLGFGLNVNMPFELLRRIDRPATSLEVEGGKVFEREQVLEAIKELFLVEFSRFLEQGFAPFFLEYRQRLMARAGRLLRFHAHGAIWEGILHDVHDDGSMSLELVCGELKKFSAGEILY